MRIEPLNREHDRTRFRSGRAELDDWFRHRASQDDRRQVARIFVAIDDAGDIVGFYSLSAFTLSISDLPAGLARKLPRYEAMPAALIGRLARDERAHGRGVGAMLLSDAIRHALSAGREMAVYAVVVDAKDESAAAFYRSFGFLPFPLRPLRLFMPTDVAIKALHRT